MICTIDNCNHCCRADGGKLIVSNISQMCLHICLMAKAHISLVLRDLIQRRDSSCIFDWYTKIAGCTRHHLTSMESLKKQWSVWRMSWLKLLQFNVQIIRLYLFFFFLTSRSPFLLQGHVHHLVSKGVVQVLSITSWYVTLYNRVVHFLRIE